ncbi:MAG TPA: hypothetical protein VE988_21255 [Gemmataceae bacterium]|nr:hypothetical protein [Gemmataceae bacterium]
MGRLRTLLLLAGGMLALSSAGCFVNQYPGDRNDRLDVLMNQSENLRQIYGEWRRFWMNDQPSHLTYDRVDGGIAPRQ